MYKGAIAFIIVLVIVGPIISAIPSDHNSYEDGIRYDRPGNFDKPLLYFVGIILYPIFGETLFFLFPIVSFFLSYMLIYWTLKEKKLNTIYLPILLLAGIAWIGSLWLFMRDTLLFLIASGFLFAIETDRIKYAWGLAVLAALTKVGGLMLIIVIILKVASQHAGFFQAWALTDYAKWIWTNVNALVDNVKGIPYAIISIFVNPVLALTLLHPNLYTLLYIFGVIQIASLGYDLHHIYRYTVFLLPFGIIRGAEILQNNGRYTIVVLIGLTVAHYLWFWFNSETLATLVGR